MSRTKKRTVAVLAAAAVILLILAVVAVKVVIAPEETALYVTLPAYAINDHTGEDLGSATLELRMTLLRKRWRDLPDEAQDITLRIPEWDIEYTYGLSKYGCTEQLTDRTEDGYGMDLTLGTIYYARDGLAHPSFDFVYLDLDRAIFAARVGLYGEADGSNVEQLQIAAPASTPEEARAVWEALGVGVPASLS